MTNKNHSAVVIGASAGAVETLSRLLPTLPPSLDTAVIVVVHLPPDKDSVMAELLQAKCQMFVKEAEDKEEIHDGVIYFAPPDYHLLVESDMTLSLSTEEPVLYSRPSIDVLFETAADAYGANLTGIILTGANHDGAAGLRTILDAGGTALVLKPELAYASVMPQAAMDACPEAYVLTLDQIATYLQKGILP